MRVATVEGAIKTANAILGVTRATASCGKEKTVDETNKVGMKSSELDQQWKKLIGFGGLCGLKDIYEKDVTSSKQKPQEEGERIEEMWQRTAKRRSGDVEQLTAQRERTNSRSRVSAK